MDANPASKTDITSIAEKNRIVKRIAEALVERDGLLLIGHRNPDEDCVAAMVALGLLASRLNKAVYIYLSGNVHAQFTYLLTICTYNSIVLLRDDDSLPGAIQTVVALDTPKPAMLETSKDIRKIIADPSVLKMEVDHHLGADSAYFGDAGFRLVLAASSASELVGYLALKMDEDPRYSRGEASGGLLARNFVLAVLTGIIADSSMGKYLKTKRERWFYERFSSLFDRLLAQKTAVGSNNFTSKEEVFKAIATLSSEEEECFRRMMSARARLPSIEYVVLNESEAAAIHDAYGEDIMTTIAKAVADALAEDGGKLGLVAYPDHPSVSDLMQFRVRRSHAYRGLDLRDVLGALSASNGGGHPGAIGFRFPKSRAPDFRGFAMDVAAKIDAIASKAKKV
ncbi:MAG: DHH family phosphoesterase [Rectinemataceae bacterium]|jgi:nanoRNase/pAp phosphatase (c-di-AMP/oligoRNAs hydrolase)